MNQESQSNKLHAVEPDKLGTADVSSSRRSPVRVEFNINNGMLIRLVGVIAILLLTWSWFMELDEITQAPGEIIPFEQVHPIRAGFDSKIEAIYVKQGDYVKKGDVLLKLDAKTFRAELEKDQQELELAKQELDRHQHACQILTAYMKDPHTMPTDLSRVNEVARAISDLYAAGRQMERAQLDMRSTSEDGNSIPEFSALKSQHQSIAENRRLKEEALANRGKHFLLEEQKIRNLINSLKQQVDLQKLAVDKQRNSLDGAQKQLAAYERVLKIGASSKIECLDARIRMEDRQKDLTSAESKQRDLEGQLESAKHELAELQSSNSMQIAEMHAGLGNIASSTAQIRMRMRSVERDYYASKASYHVALRAANSTCASEISEINNIKKQIEELNASVSSTERSYLKGELQAPVDGTIALMNFQGVGEVVHHGDDILTIVPTNEHLVASVNVPNEQIAFLHQGELVKLQFPAYPYQQYGTIPARISMIAAYPHEDKEHPPSFRVILVPQRDWIVCRNRKIPLRQGLEVEAQLVLRKRRLLITLLSPLLRLQYEHFKA